MLDCLESGIAPPRVSSHASAHFSLNSREICPRSTECRGAESVRSASRRYLGDPSCFRRWKEWVDTVAFPGGV